MKLMSRAALCGAGWGLLADGLFPIQFGDHFSRWSGFLAGAAVGTLIGALVHLGSRWLYRPERTVALLLWSIPTMYLAAALWGALAMGAHLLAAGPMAGWGGPWGHLIGGAAVACWGLTVIPLNWLFFPLAAATHLWMRAHTTEAA